MPQEAIKPRISVKKMLMAPFLAGMSALLLLGGIGLYSQYITYYTRQLDSSHDAVGRFYQFAVEDSKATMSGLLEVLAADSRLYPLLQSRDVAGLKELYRDMFRKLHGSMGLTHFSFVAPDRQVVLRLHAPERHGDYINRFLFQEVERVQTSVAGVDTDGSGRLTFRMIKPVLNGDLLIGYLESAVELERLLTASRHTSGIELAFVLQKHLFPMDNELTNGEVLANGRFWLSVDANSFIYTSMLGLDKAFAQSLLRHNISSSRNGPNSRFSLFYDRSYYVVSILPVTNSLGTRTGDLYLIEDATKMWHEYLTMAVILMGSALAVVLVCRYLAARKMSDADEQIEQIVDSTRQSDVILANIFEESETGFVLQNWTTGEVLKANRVALSIFNAKYAKDIDIVDMHPLPMDHPLQKAWQLSGSVNPLMSITTEKGASYCEIDLFFIGANEEMQCIAIRDVTRVVLLQIENNEQIEYQQNIIDQLPSLVFIKDSNSRLTLYNAAFERVMAGGAQMMGKEFFIDWSGITTEEIREEDVLILSTNQPRTYEGKVRNAEGECHTYLVSKKVINGKGGKNFLLCVCTDITERSAMEKQLIALREKADAANLAKSQFLAHMSHEIRTPMNVIIGMSHLAMNADPDERQRNYLMKIQNAAKNLLGIINDILDFSKIEAGEMHLEEIPFNLHEVLSEIDVQCQTLVMDKEVEFLLDQPDYKGDYLGDPLRMRQVLLNLVNNAIKFTRQGHVTLICKVVSETPDDIQLYFAVEDTGIGIPSEAMSRLFTSFQQVDGSTTRRFGGTGLGLAISLQFVNFMGGKISVQSQEGEGSTFYFTITLKKALGIGKESSLPGVAAAWRDFDGLGKDAAEGGEKVILGIPDSARVLVVEDNEINQEIIIELLEGYGINVSAAANGQVAIDLLKEQIFDLVFMDLQMPIMDGLTATKVLRELVDSPMVNVPVIALTANAMYEDRDRCLAAGMNDFLSKPIEVRELEAKLHHWLSRPHKTTE